MIGKKNLFSIAFFLLTAIIIFYILFADQKMSEEKFILFYTDLIIAQDSLGNDLQSNEAIRKSLFEKYDVSESEYQNTLDYFNQKSERWESFFGKVIEHLEKRQAENLKKE
ncbi:MAG: hypothetical protein C0425_02735 [Chlorobiaceae bacterium]|nr:hypothetical protein [Chlorobiaceae bacterium]MBA4309238.1 hypothetical protein [Chlorobiaceae bacterium]